MVPGSEGIIVAGFAFVLLAVWVVMAVGVVCWFLHLRRFGAILMMGAGGGLVGFLFFGVLIIIALAGMSQAGYHLPDLGQSSFLLRVFIRLVCWSPFIAMFLGVAAGIRRAIRDTPRKA